MAHHQLSCPIGEAQARALRVNDTAVQPEYLVPEINN